MDKSDWSNGIRYHIFDTRPDTEFKVDMVTGAGHWHGANDVGQGDAAARPQAH